MSSACSALREWPKRSSSGLKGVCLRNGWYIIGCCLHFDNIAGHKNADSFKAAPGIARCSGRIRVPAPSPRKPSFSHPLSFGVERGYRRPSCALLTPLCPPARVFIHRRASLSEGTKHLLFRDLVTLFSSAPPPGSTHPYCFLRLLLHPRFRTVLLLCSVLWVTRKLPANVSPDPRPSLDFFFSSPFFARDA